MIDDAMIKKIAKECECEYDPGSCSYGFYDRHGMDDFAKACYAAGQDAQRESDAMAARDAARAAAGY